MKAMVPEEFFNLSEILRRGSHSNPVRGVHQGNAAAVYEIAFFMGVTVSDP